jgi:hypothetical protein
VGKDREAHAFLAWLLHASRLARPRLPALFTLDGRPGPRERVLHDWPGFGYGWVLDAAWLVTDRGHRLDGETWRAMRGFAERIACTWQLPGAGIWERRDAPRHHVHSKLMAWLALDRAARIAERRGGRNRRRSEVWRSARDRLGEDLRRHGYDQRLGAYTAAYGATDLDASVLLMPLVGVEPSGSPRLAGTVDTLWSRLGAGGPLLYRYLDDDGLPGGEGAFLPCSFWLVQALAWLGRRDEAEDLFAESSSRSAARSASTPRRWTPGRGNSSATSPRPSPTPPSSRLRSRSTPRIRPVPEVVRGRRCPRGIGCCWRSHG